ncbi:uncharacterized protein CDV56_103102 [Aspergillus thermomutatus]|uniref:Uncharacterized protein n=1 Tax=Aspergillus thermomutatus TaxID=41047 RepID=A0A397HSG5_ASPTH|nr:uncharacterized protein CDV56_103102 [Aspergillus thermomutatus]RHZ64264.1 hypothetical protein CDV56_103102 [Aspergillus thermomutatus]
MPCFFDLPQHIRDQIYRYSLLMGRVFIRPFTTVEVLTDLNRTDTYGTPNLALLWTSKRIYEEAMPIYLSENTFSLVQVDLLAAARAEYPRVFENLRKIRNLELVFDCRDYIYLAQFLSRELPGIAAAVQDAKASSKYKRKVIEKLDEMQVDFDIPRIEQTESDPDEELSSEEEHEIHDQHIENMKEYLWGRTMSFVRQTFQLSRLYIDLRHCTCNWGCCRLATEVLAWGWFHVWIHGMPDEIHVRGTSGREKKIIARLFDKQRFHAGLEIDQVFDQDRLGDADDWKAGKFVFQEVHQRLVR